MTAKNYFPWFCARIFVGAIFVVAGFLKLIDPVENFRGMIAAYGVIPYDWIGVIAHTMPWVEFLAGLGLAVGYLPRVFAVILGGLATSFVGLIVWAYLNGTLPANCGCFGEGVHMTPYQMAALDCLNSLITLRLFQMKDHRWCVVA